MLDLEEVVTVGSSDAQVTQLYTTVQVLEEELVVVEWASDAHELPRATVRSNT